MATKQEYEKATEAQRERQNMTKLELEAEIARLKAENEELKSQLTSREAALRQSGEAGYLLTARNSEYFGTVRGVRFAGGKAFVSDSTPDVERLVRELASDFGYEVMRYTAQEYERLGQPQPKPKTGLEALIPAGG